MSRGNTAARRLLVAVAVAALVLVGGATAGAAAYAQPLPAAHVQTDGCVPSAVLSLGQEVAKTVPPDSVRAADWVRDAAPSSIGEVSPLDGVWPLADAASQLAPCASVVPGVPAEVGGLRGTAALGSGPGGHVYDLAGSFVAPRAAGVVDDLGRQVSGFGGSIDNIAVSDAVRIQNAADRIGHPISVVGSRVRCRPGLRGWASLGISTSSPARWSRTRRLSRSIRVGSGEFDGF